MKFNNETIRTAVKEWLDNSNEAESKYGHISNWDVSNVTDMNEMFFDADSFNQDIGKWDVSNVTDMSSMFSKAKSFNQDIGKWDVSNVTNMCKMFKRAYRFNKPLNKWKVSNVTNMYEMFFEAKLFNRTLNNWNVGKVTNMDKIFYEANSLNKIIKWYEKKLMFEHLKNLLDFKINVNRYYDRVNEKNIDISDKKSDNKKTLNINISKTTNFSVGFYGGGDDFDEFEVPDFHYKDYIFSSYSIQINDKKLVRKKIIDFLIENKSHHNFMDKFRHIAINHKIETDNFSNSIEKKKYLEKIIDLDNEKIILECFNFVLMIVIEDYMWDVIDKKGIGFAGGDTSGIFDFNMLSSKVNLDYSYEEIDDWDE